MADQGAFAAANQPDDQDQYSSDLAVAGAAPAPGGGGSPLQQSATAREMLQQGRQLITDDPAGALSAAAAKKDAARQAQIESINRAREILQASNDRVNLPLFAASTALMAPTRTGGFGDALANAGQAAMPAFQQQRKNEGDVANLDVQAAAVAAEGAKEGYQDFLTRFGLGRQLEQGASNDDLRRTIAATNVQRAQIGADAGVTRAQIGAGARLAAATTAAGARTDAASIAADSRDHTTDTNAGVKLTTAFKPVTVTAGPTIQTFDPLTRTYTDTGIPTTAEQRQEWQQNQGDKHLQILQQQADTAKLRAEQGNHTYLGVDPDDPKSGIYLDKRSGETSTGPAVAGKAGAADPARIREAKSLVSQGVAPDFTTAYGMVRAGVNDTNTFQRLVQAEKKIIQGTPQGMSMTDKAAESQARETVIARARAAPGTAAQPAAQAVKPAAPGAVPAPVGKPIDPDAKQQYDDAIAAGKPKAALIQRLKQAGYDTSGL